MKRRKNKTSQKKVHRVYCTYFPDGRYYIGYSCKTDKQFEKYYGSSKLIKEYSEPLKKEVIVTFNNRNQAKLQEMLLQLQYREDDNCINDMIHIRLRMKYIKDFMPIDWKPKTYKSIT